MASVTEFEGVRDENGNHLAGKASSALKDALKGNSSVGARYENDEWVPCDDYGVVRVYVDTPKSTSSDTPKRAPAKKAAKRATSPSSHGGSGTSNASSGSASGSQGSV